MLMGLRRSAGKAGIPLWNRPIAVSQGDPSALRAPAGREPDRAPALRAVGDRALVCFVARPAAMRIGIASDRLRASSEHGAAALGAYVTVIANRTTNRLRSSAARLRP